MRTDFSKCESVDARSQLGLSHFISSPQFHFTPKYILKHMKRRAEYTWDGFVANSLPTSYKLEVSRLMFDAANNNIQNLVLATLLLRIPCITGESKFLFVPQPSICVIQPTATRKMAIIMAKRGEGMMEGELKSLI